VQESSAPHFTADDNVVALVGAPCTRFEKSEKHRKIAIVTVKRRRANTTTSCHQLSYRRDKEVRTKLIPSQTTREFLNHRSHWRAKCH
jgi:hypothetical protein